MTLKRNLWMSLAFTATAMFSLSGCESGDDANPSVSSEPAASIGAERIPALDDNSCGPTGDLRGDPENGQQLHVEHCVACHGLTGAADVVVMHMDETPPDQSDA